MNEVCTVIILCYTQSLYIRMECLQGKTVVAVTSGANMNFDRLRIVADLAAVGARQEAIFVTTIPECTGSFKNFMDVALADTDIQITEFKYRQESTIISPPPPRTMPTLIRIPETL